MHAAQRQHGFRYLLLLLLVAAPSVSVAGARNSSVGVRNDVELQQALLDPGVEHVVLLQDIQLQAGNWYRTAGSRSNLTNRNITISSEPPYQTLDFAFLASNWLRLGAGKSLNISQTILKQGRYGAGMQLDFLAPAAGTMLILWDSIVVRHLCIEYIDEPTAIEHVPSLPGFPAKQRAHYNTSYCLADRCYHKVLIYDSFTKVSTGMTDTAAGGYGLALFNVSKVCLAYATQCTDSLVVESCMQRALDALPLAAQTPGRIQAAAEAATAAAAAAEDRRRQQATLAGAISAGCGAFVLLMLVFGLLIRHRRSLQRSEKAGGTTLLPVVQPPGSPGHESGAGFDKSAGSKDLQVAVAGEGVGLGSHWYPVRDAEAVLDQPGSCTTRSSHSSRSRAVSQLKGIEFVQEQPAGPPSLQDQWELVAWKTSSHSSKRILGQQQQLLHGVSDFAASLDSGQLSSPLSGGSHKELSSRDLMLQGTGASTTQAVVNANKIHMGVCIGAGSFGKVYRAKWRGMDVAVKVVHHSQAAAASVANEVDLTMSFQHPNVVAAYHFVTWRRRKERAHNSDQLFSPVVHQMTHSSGSLPLSCGNNLAAESPHSGGFHLQDDDMQTYIVQEFCDAGNLGDYCIIHGSRQEGQLPTGHEMLRLLFRMREVASGMQFLHDVARVVHGDLKSSNILLCVAPTAPYGRTAKVADFGLARVYAAGETHKSTRTLGTVNHMSPEMLRYGKASASADVYSFGIMFWELLTGQVAFRGWQWGAILEHVALSDGRPPIPEGAPEDFVLLLESCWHKDPARRPAFTEVVKCLSIMITSRQQELIEHAAGVTLRTHTVTAALSATAASPDPLLSNSSTNMSQASTCPSAAQMSASAVTATNSSVDEWDIVRVGSMRGHVSGASISTARSSPTQGAGSSAARGSNIGFLQPPRSAFWREGQAQVQPGRQQQQQQQTRLQPAPSQPQEQDVEQQQQQQPS